MKEYQSMTVGKRKLFGSRNKGGWEKVVCEILEKKNTRMKGFAWMGAKEKLTSLETWTLV